MNCISKPSVLSYDGLQKSSDTVLLSELNFSRLYCVLKTYLDESYNDKIMCVGGWMCSDQHWDYIEKSWSERITFENRISRLKGLKPLTRYHASNCNALKGEFEGWNRDRQVRFIKKLLQILERAKPAGVVCGARFSDYQKYFPGPSWEKRKEKNLYFVSMISCLLQTLDYAVKGYPEEKVMVIYDRKDKYHSVALEAFDYVSSHHKQESL
jgi:hypothetical protein